jgi:hypothetical protein
VARPQPTAPAAPATPPADQGAENLSPADQGQTGVYNSHEAEPRSVSFGTEDPTPVAELRNINSPAVYFDGNAATGAELDAILRRYGSPHEGKGEVMAEVARREGINPVLLLAVMQQESSFGNVNNNRTLKPENVANPWSVHFNHNGEGIAMLRHPDGRMPTFEESLNSAVRTLKNLAGDSATPLSTAGTRYAEDDRWTRAVTGHYENLLRRLDGLR